MEIHKRSPPPPIPKQRLPGWLRWPLRIALFPLMFLDLLAQSLVHRISPPPYKIEGGCKKRGHCCHYILLSWPEIMETIPWVGKFWMWWYTEVNGFYLRGFDLENEKGQIAKVMGCRYLRKDGLCQHHALRPAICRQWPRIEYAARPHLLKGCGYKVVPRQGPLHALPPTSSRPIEPPLVEPPTQAPSQAPTLSEAPSQAFTLSEAQPQVHASDEASKTDVTKL